MYSVVSSVPAIYHIKCLLHGLASEENKFSSIQVLFTLTRFSNHKKMANALILFLRKATEKKKLNRNSKWNWVLYETTEKVQICVYSLVERRKLFIWSNCTITLCLHLESYDTENKQLCQNICSCLSEIYVAAK